MQRAEVERHPGYNVVVAKLFDTHDRLREVTKRLDDMAREVASRRSDSAPIDRGWLRMAVAMNDMLQQVMHAHHTTEDEIIFPYLRAHKGFDPSKLGAEHEELTTAMPALQAALVPLLAPNPIPREAVDAFATAAKNLHEGLGKHLDNEEATAVVALLALTGADIQRMFGGRL